VLSSNLRKVFVIAMQFVDDYRIESANVEALNIEFTGGDLLLGSKLHNRLLLVPGDLEDIPVNRIMRDCGPVVNLLPLRTFTRLGYTVRNLTTGNILIQGFNQTGQQALGTTRLTLKFHGWISTSLFHVIDAFTSYNAFLRHPWFHEHGTDIKVSSLNHEKKRLGRVFADTRPFIVAEDFMLI